MVERRAQIKKKLTEKRLYCFLLLDNTIMEQVMIHLEKSRVNTIYSSKQQYTMARDTLTRARGNSLECYQ